MALEARFGCIHPLMFEGKCPGAGKERRKAIRKSTLRTPKTDRVGPYAPVGPVVPQPAGAIRMGIGSLATKALQAPGIYSEVQRPVFLIPRTPVMDSG